VIANLTYFVATFNTLRFALFTLQIYNILAALPNFTPSIGPIFSSNLSDFRQMALICRLAGR